MKLALSDRELATVLAPLRYWERNLIASAEKGGGPVLLEHFEDA
jgi:hypothetical protein